MEYQDIIHLPHQQSKTRKRMSVRDRAAQFAPFAALTGYEDAVKETARLTREYTELDEYEREELDRKLRLLRENLHQNPAVTVTFFVPDEQKEGGEYVTLSGNIKKILPMEGLLILEEERQIPVEKIVSIDCEMFEHLL